MAGGRGRSNRSCRPAEVRGRGWPIDLDRTAGPLAMQWRDGQAGPYGPDTAALEVRQRICDGA